jgi:hypothetical protein
MARNMNWKSWVILGCAVTILLTSGGLVLASNMGFKINKQIYPSWLLSGVPKRDNWISIPYNSPYADAKKLCTAFGTTAAGFTIFQLNPATGTQLVNYPCSLSTVVALDAARGIRIRNTSTVVPIITNGVLVGSSNEATSLPTILGGFLVAGAPKKDNWISVPYHTTWIKAEDVCVSLGMGGGTGNIIRNNPDPVATPNAISHPCGNTTINNFALVIGEALNVRKTTAGDIVGKLPPHF